MNLLITGAAKASSALISALKNVGWDIDIHSDEKEPVVVPEKYDAVVCNGLFLNSPIESFLNLKVIQLTSAGLDRVPLDYIEQNGIKLFNAKGVYSAPMAEWAVASILNEYKHIPAFRHNQQQNKWMKDRSLRELGGKNIAIIGAGNVGGEVAKRLDVFGARIIGYDIFPASRPHFSSIREISEFNPDNFDIIILTAPLTPQTHHIVKKDTLLAMKNDSILINMSRGALIDENDLIEVLNDRTDIVAILDVFEQEPLNEDSPLWRMSNIRIFPHNSFVGEANDSRLHNLILSNLSKPNQTLG